MIFTITSRLSVTRLPSVSSHSLPAVTGEQFVADVIAIRPLFHALSLMIRRGCFERMRPRRKWRALLSV